MGWGNERPMADRKRDYLARQRLERHVAELTAALDAAEAKVRTVEAILTEFVNVRGDFYEPSPLIAMIDRLACTLRIALRTDWRSFAASSDGTG